MRIYLYIFLIITFFIIVRCDHGPDYLIIEKEYYDTIKPAEYFPAFPGSWWIYNNKDTMKSLAYEKYIFNSAGYNATPDPDTLALPKLLLNGVFNPPDTFAYVKQHSISKARNGDARDPAFKHLLSTTPGNQFQVGGSFQGHRITGKTLSVENSLIVANTRYDSVVITIQYDNYFVSGMNGVAPEECATVREYYAKHIGLIKRETRNYPQESDFITTLELTGYFIEEDK